MKTNKLILKFSALAGGVLSASVTSHAAVVQSTTVGSGISPTTSWDVDNDGTVDFQLVGNGSMSFDDSNGGRKVAPDFRTFDGLAKLSPGFVVGPSMAGFHFSADAQSAVTIVSSGAIGGDARNQGWSLGDTSNFGFEFTSGGSTYYGWGTLQIAANGSNFSITEAYYESTAGASIVVGTTSSIPEPASTAALLGLGAVGVAAWRRRRALAA